MDKLTVLRQAYNYNIYFDFIESYLSSGFLNINPDDPIIQQIEGLTQQNNQFITAADMSQMNYLYASKRCNDMLGIAPAELDPGFFMTHIHPDDLQRLALGRVKMMKVSQEVYANKKGSALMSFTLRIRNPKGTYNQLLGQAYFFHSTIPHDAVFLIQVITNVDWCKKINPDGHYYVGKDLSLFKFPTENLLKIGSNLSDREFEIVRLNAMGMTSQQIAEKLFLSVHTVSTHRSNILQKTEKSSIADLIVDLKNMGLL